MYGVSLLADSFVTGCLLQKSGVCWAQPISSLNYKYHGTDLCSSVLDAGDVVHNLLEKPFLARNVAEQKAIVQQLRPMPELEKKTKDHVFQDRWFSKKDSLCGSAIIESLFFWSNRDHRNHGRKQTTPCLCFFIIHLYLLKRTFQENSQFMHFIF